MYIYIHMCVYIYIYIYKMRTYIDIHVCVCVYVCAKLLQSCPILCDPTDCSPPSSSVHGILQVRMLEWVAIPTSRRSSQHRNGTVSDISSALARRFLTTSTTWDTRNIKYTYTYVCVSCVCVHVC